MIEKEVLENGVSYKEMQENKDIKKNIKNKSDLQRLNVMSNIENFKNARKLLLNVFYTDDSETTITENEDSDGFVDSNTIAGAIFWYVKYCLFINFFFFVFFFV